MKMPCGIIKDLLPLYFEGIASEETRSYVEEHLAECESCKKELEQIGRTDVIAPNNNIAPLKKIKRVLQRKRIIAVAFSVTLTLTFAFLCLGYLYTPRPLPYKEGMFSFATDKNGVVSVTINQPASAFFLDRSDSKELGGQVYYLSASTDYFNQRDKTHLKYDSFILNENSENIASVYYSPDDGTENILIFGKEALEGGSSVTLPRLVLTYYALIAVLFAGLVGVAIAISIKLNNKMLKCVLLRICYFPCSYLVAHFLVKGLDSQTYALGHDLSKILLITMPIYLLCLLVERFFRKEPLPWGGGG